MKSHIVLILPSPATQQVRSGGRGYLRMVTISHSQAATQSASFYDRDGLELARYQVAPGASPFSVVFTPGNFLWFTNGLQVNSGECTVNLNMVY